MKNILSNIKAVVGISNGSEESRPGKKISEGLMVDTETTLSILIDNIKTGILFENKDQKIVLANNMFWDMFDIPARTVAIQGENNKIIAQQQKFLFQNPDVFITRVNHILLNKTPVIAERLFLLDGRILERDYFPIIVQEKYKGHIWMYNDVTAEMKHEKAVRIQVEKYRNIISNMNLGLMEVDKDDLIISTNDIFCDISGYTRDELIGKKALEILLSQSNANIINDKVQLRSHGFIDVYQAPILNKHGDERWWLMSDAPNYNDDGDLIGSIGIHMDISDQKKMERELEIARQKAEDSSKAKETFLANMSHEIRTPMTGILGIVNILGKTNLDEEQKKYVKIISDSANNLLTIVNDVLDIEKIAAGKLDFEYIPFKLEEKVYNALQAFQYKAEGKNITLVMKNELPDDLVVVGDPYRLGQILNNLLGNALKFTQEGEISVCINTRSISGSSALIEFAVKDSGIGIKKEKLNDIFSPFIQASSDTSRKFGGTGLGLTICKNLVEMQGGKISVGSVFGEGTTFTFTIPYQVGNAAMIPEEVREDLNYDELNAVRVLVAEDVELNQFLVKHILDSWGCDVTIVSNGRDAVEQVKENNFDLVLMDIHMPEMDGRAATKMIRGMSSQDRLVITKKSRTLGPRDKSAIPIIALTANALKGDGQKYLDMGMNGYVAKPYTEEKLFHAINEVLKTNASLKNKLPIPALQQVAEVPLKNTRLYDLELINTIGKNDPQFVKKIASIYLETMPPSISQLVAAAKAGKAKEVGLIAHKMKAMIDTLGVHPLHDPIRQLEKTDKITAETRILIELVNKTLNALFVQLNELL